MYRFMSHNTAIIPLSVILEEGYIANVLIPPFLSGSRVRKATLSTAVPIVGLSPLRGCHTGHALTVY